MANHSVLLSTIVLYLLIAVTKSAIAAYPPNLLNNTGCLYSYLDGGHYNIHFHDSEDLGGDLNQFALDKTSNCTDKIYPGKLVIEFQISNNNMKTMTLDLVIKPSPSEGYWEVNNATLHIVPQDNAQQRFPNNTIQLKPVDIYAGLSYSFSCSSLVLQNLVHTKESPEFKIKLNKFQLQPFAELPNAVFAPSYDCAVWLTLPVIMGLLLVLFITFTVMMGVNLILAQGNQTSEIRFSKQGGMLMNQAQLDATKG